MHKKSIFLFFVVAGIVGKKPVCYLVQLVHESYIVNLIYIMQIVVKGV